jgi:hypothetical protein
MEGENCNIGMIYCLNDISEQQMLIWKQGTGDENGSFER